MIRRESKIGLYRKIGFDELRLTIQQCYAWLNVIDLRNRAEKR